MTIKALTLWQPWASAMALGLKKIETRSWQTYYRGLLAIHAAVRPMDALGRQLAEWGQIPVVLPYGSITCIVRLVDCVECGNSRVNQAMRSRRRRLTAEEYHWGNYDAGRFAWITEHLLSFEPAIVHQGARQLWNYELPDMVATALRDVGVRDIRGPLFDSQAEPEAEPENLALVQI